MAKHRNTTDESGRGRLHALSVWFLCLGFFVSAGLARADEQNPTTRDCLYCHGTSAAEGMSYDTLLAGSIHQGMECRDCHAAITTLPHAEHVTPVDCGTCHDDAAKTYQWHGRLKVGEGKDIPVCADCHGRHDILSVADKHSRVHPQNLPQTCGRCHENLDLTTKHKILYEKAVEVYESSVHGRASLGGMYVAATCNDCHSAGGTAHRILPPGFPDSPINHFNIPKTCGKCHRAIESDYWEGIHGQLTIRGETDSPVCTDCHGEHGILPVRDPRSPVSPTRLAQATCAPCHESARLNDKYGIPTGRLQSYIDTYHGLKSKAGDLTVANCASCHGAHRILPHTDPSSSIYPGNLPTTCGHCHPGISAALATVPIHGVPGVSRTPAANWVRNIYLIAIFLIIGTMIVHWLLDLRKQIKLVLGQEQVIRMSFNALWQHTFLMITFTVLVITGFSLRFSEAWWVRLLFGWEGGFPVRGIIHRVAAVIFILTTIWHLVFLATRQGRKFLREMWPAQRDFREFLQIMLFNLGMKPDRPRFGQFSYVEKAEYWALVWGTAIMILTGLLLWFDSVAEALFPKGVLDVIVVMHYYEAWLATLAIAIWHMYSTIFSPGVYPMNPSWLTGKMPRRMLEHEHPNAPMLTDEADCQPKAAAEEENVD